MSEHKAIIRWTQSQGDFLKGTYSREHTWTFDGGMTIAASSSPAAVRVPFSNPANADPEEAYVASLSSCHMLWFLYFAAKRGFVVDRYHDEAVGVMTKNASGKQAITQVTLHPEVSYSGDKRPPDEEQKAMHHEAHESCFIANSVKTEVRCEPVTTAS